MKTTVDISGMHCPACADRLTRAFRAVPGVTGARVTLNPARAEVESSAPVPVEVLDAAARGAGGYSVRRVASVTEAPAGQGSAGPAAGTAGSGHDGHAGHAVHLQGAHAPSAAPPSSDTRSADAVGAAGGTSGAASGTSDASGGAVVDATPRASLYPLVLIVLYIAGTVALATWFRGGFRGGAGDWSAFWPSFWASFMNDFMAGFFLVFSFFKLLDLRGFASVYRGYDVIARRWPLWGLVYPFVELALGVAYVIRWEPVITNWATLVVMAVGAVGVLGALMRKDAIRCACLGTALNLPMTTVTLIEDVGMAAMAGAMLVWH